MPPKPTKKVERSWMADVYDEASDPIAARRKELEDKVVIRLDTRLARMWRLATWPPPRRRSQKVLCRKSSLRILGEANAEILSAYRTRMVS